MRSKFPKYPLYKRIDESSSVSTTYNRVQQLQQPLLSLVVLCVCVREREKEREGRSIEACEGGNRLKTIEQKRGGGEKA
jgi:hypothetical protein